MDREEILILAEANGIDFLNTNVMTEHVIAFANAIAAHEREAIANMVGEKLEGTVMSKYSKVEECKSHRMLLAECIADIRSRGNK